MRIRIDPGGRLQGTTRVPGDKSIAHRWLILAATAQGHSRIFGVPPSLDVLSTASCLAAISPRARPALEAWSLNRSGLTEGNGSTWNLTVREAPESPLELEGDGRHGLVKPARDLDCGNSGTAMRLLCGLLGGAPFQSVLTGDQSLSSRPMERVAGPLRSMGASVVTTDGHAPVTVEGAALRGIRYETSVPTAQVKGAVLIAGTAAEGETVFVEPANTRDHTERALAALGAPVTVDGTAVSVRRFQHGGLRGTVPGDPSSAAFLIAGAALTGSELMISDVGLNPSRLHFLEVMERMGVGIQTRVLGEEIGEPVGEIRVDPGAEVLPVQVGQHELPLVIDEVPILCFLAAHARAESRFVGAGELRNKESDRLSGVAQGIADLGGAATAEGEDLVVAGGGLAGGSARAGGDHRLAMALAISALAAGAPCEIEGMECSEVSFPGFVPLLSALGARIEVTG